MTGGRATAEIDLTSPEPITKRKIVAPPRPDRPSPLLLRQRLVAADALAIALGLVLAFAWQAVVRSNDQLGVQRRHLTLALIALPVWLVVMSLNKLYLARAVARAGEEVRRIINASFISVGVVLAVAFALQFKTLSRLWVVSMLVFVPVLLIMERTVARRMFARMRRTGVLTRPIVIVGTDADAVGLMHAAQRQPELGYDVVGFVGPDDLGVRGGVTVLGGFEDTAAVLEETGATGVMISLASVPSASVNRLTRELCDEGYHVALSSGLRDIDIARFRPQELGGRTLVYVEQVQREGWHALAKRAFDITVAVVALVLAAPVMLVAAIAIKRSSPGPVIFAQERIGRDGRPFQVLKFRTMVVDADARKAELAHRNEADGPMFKIADDPRVTRVGALLRKFSIDEIPQFVNVLRGEMSVVGPRPALGSEVEQWTDDVHDRLRVLPGITGMWQVSGRSDTTFEEYKRLDLYYVDNWSLAHDLRIVLKTFSAVVASRGAR
jgi:exopolysaccharide biosynthesis polyprenyl glycosylphosphotransferase